MDNAGVCKIKAEFVLPEQERRLNLHHVSEQDKALMNVDAEADTLRDPEEDNEDEAPTNDDHEIEEEESAEPAVKKPKFGKQKRLKGQNKKRGRAFVFKKEDELCDFLVQVQEGDEVPQCNRKKCFNMHDISEYLAKKPEDIKPGCYNFQQSGKCIRGLACRFGKEHITEGGRNVVLQSKYEEYVKNGPYVKNQLGKDVQFALRKRSYDFNLAEKLLDSYEKKSPDNMNPDELFAFLKRPNRKTFGTVTDEDIIRLKSKEKKKIDWANKLYLSPLTTVGNLPFRRICKEYGADITCGEMALCSSLLQGMPQEWALMKRHHTEDLFGVQLCANNPHMLAKCGQIIEKECDIDFVDLNLGCPIEWVFRRGGGSGLLLRPRILESCVRNLNDILTVPMTVKTRTGAYKDENVADELAPKFKEWGVSLITIHGRSREQRYTKSADWAYISEVAQKAKPLPVFGCGDILSFKDYQNFRQIAPEVAGVMIGRGALIKPWIFSEIKEQKIYDISSRERFDIIQKYVNYGLEHWGSDNRGVENTRRFLLEWLSFLYRYIPVGLLENPPQKINERPPYFKGRDDLETLMASPAASDWVKISEMFLGKVPDGYKFIPKHKANSYQ